MLSKNEAVKEIYESRGTLLPNYTHSMTDTFFTHHWVTLREAICDLPALRAEKGKNQSEGYNGLHKVPLLDEKNCFGLTIPKKEIPHLTISV